MPATRTDATLNGPFTQAEFGTALQTALAAAGFASTPHDDESATPESAYYIYRLIYDTNSPKQTAYLQINFKLIDSTLALSQKLYDSWSANDSTGTNGGTETAVKNFNTNFPVFLTSISHPEARLVLLLQGDVYCVLGLFRPANLPSFWGSYINSFLYAFAATDTDCKQMKGLAATGTPYNNASASPIWEMPALKNSNTLMGANPVTEVMYGPYLQTPNETGSNGQFSQDFAIVASTGMQRLQAINVPLSGGGTDKWLLIGPAVSSGFAIKVT
jgi:hypothetical protein